MTSEQTIKKEFEQLSEESQKILKQKFTESQPPIKLNLGCSDVLLEGYFNIDIQPPPQYDSNKYWFESIDLNPKHPDDHWPLPDSTVTQIIAHDIFEHLGGPGYEGQRGIIWCMNESHRVLVNGGILDLVVPCLPGIAPWVDPTHRTVWVSDLRYYFDERWNNPQGERGRLGPAYGITALFKTVGGRSGKNWTPVHYAADAPNRCKLFLQLEAVK